MLHVQSEKPSCAMDIGTWHKSRSYSIQLGRNCSKKESKFQSEPKWKSFWRKIMKKNNNKRKTACFVYSYDHEDYMQNFDEGFTRGNVDVLCRSFSARFANPSRKDMLV
ncbi:hypothetical protein QVD17_01866 [Tagetes erecta]|uniref:Uncharacterized protein n=1 Tax=Tagetes erecta TaxID=13708 RepID=A0AAD8LBI0_TARER|nr:hypothetical protein QVD17_01866 [Tagetes erecta]